MFKIFSGKKKFIFIVLVILLIGGYYFSSSKNGVVQYEFADVSRQNIVQEVSVTGTVEADPKINLKFQTAGKIVSMPVSVGDFISKGNVLAALDSTALSISVEQAEANLSLAEANYNKVVAGNTDEAVAVAEAALEKAQVDYDQSVSNLENVEALSEDALAAADLSYQSALTSYENASATYGEDLSQSYEDAYDVLNQVFNQVDNSMREIDNVLGVDTETINDDFELALESMGNSYKQATNDYEDNKLLNADLYSEYTSISFDDHEEMDILLVEVSELVDAVDSLLDDTDYLLLNAPIIGGYTDDIKDTRRALIYAEISSLTTVNSSLSAAIQAVESAYTSEDNNLKSAQDALDEAEQALSTAQTQSESDISSAEISVSVYEALLSQAEASLDQVDADPRDVDLEGLQASIDSAQSALDLANYNLSLATLVATVSGIVAELNFDIGENVTINEDFLVMVSSDYQIKANVSETDITKVKVGDKIGMTLDAFSYDKVFDAEIAEIDPAETVVEGVIYYQITAVFTTDDTEIKPGMTANMAINTASIDNALAVPIRAVKYDGARTYVLQVDSVGETYETDIEVGVKGDQYVEVVSGLSEGDKVVTYVR
jgi:RND family efflux transporter MFP subunit